MILPPHVPRPLRDKLIRANYLLNLTRLFSRAPLQKEFTSPSRTVTIIETLLRKPRQGAETHAFDSAQRCLEAALAAIGSDEYYVAVDESWAYCGLYRIKARDMKMGTYDFELNANNEIRLFDTRLTCQVTINYLQDENLGPAYQLSQITYLR